MSRIQTWRGKDGAHFQSAVLSDSQWEGASCCCAPGVGVPGSVQVVAPLSDSLCFQMYLRELLRLMHLRFYQHLVSLGEDGLQMLFCHRWILLCFKREFPDAEALRMWEACWAHYQVRAQTTGAGHDGAGVFPLLSTAAFHCWRAIRCVAVAAGMQPPFHSPPSACEALKA